jgi:RNA polymerase sigma factor (sigma-70 family)
MSRPEDASQPVTAGQLGELFDRHAAALALYAAQWTGAGEDCVQEALIELARQPQVPENPAAWLYRVVRNRALNAARSERRRSTHEQAAHAPGDRRINEVGAAPTFELTDALTTLDPTTREIVILRVWGQLSWEEIAAVVGGSKSAAQRHYVQALQQLRRIWEHDPCPTNNPCPTN